MHVGVWNDFLFNIPEKKKKDTKTIKKTLVILRNKHLKLHLLGFDRKATSSDSACMEWYVP